MRSVDRVPPAKPATRGITKRSQLQTLKAHKKNGAPVFDPETFLAQTGLGRTVLTLKKNEQAFAQGDPADAVFYVQKGQIKVTVTSASGKEATIGLVMR